MYPCYRALLPSARLYPHCHLRLPDDIFVAYRGQRTSESPPSPASRERRDEPSPRRALLTSELSTTIAVSSCRFSFCNRTQYRKH